METLRKGIEFLLNGSDRQNIDKPVHIIFCHKNEYGQFINGMMSEELMQMMIARQQYLVDKDTCTDNIQALLYLKKALDCMNNRSIIKMQKKRNDSTRNGVPVQTKGTTS